MGCEDGDNILIEHIDCNGLNNLDENVRESSRSTIRKNCINIHEDNIWSNVTIQGAFNGNPYINVSRSGKNKEKYRRRFYYTDSNFDSLKHEAIIVSITERKKNGYRLNKDDLDYIKKHDLKIS
jgi:uncharacterized cysteine cluster protein YcgN (CxxCxxCC family)